MRNQRPLPVLHIPTHTVKLSACTEYTHFTYSTCNTDVGSPSQWLRDGWSVCEAQTGFVWPQLVLLLHARRSKIKKTRFLSPKAFKLCPEEHRQSSNNWNKGIPACAAEVWHMSYSSRVFLFF